MDSKASDDHTSVRADNFKLIRGVNALIGSRLHRAGILTYAQFASLAPEDIITLIGNLPGVTPDRIIRQHWTEQARELALQSESETSQDTAALTKEGSYYATFVTELLLDTGDHVLHTRVRHVQTGEEETWDGWKEDWFVKFFMAHTGLRASQGVAKQETEKDESVPAAVSLETPAFDPAEAEATRSEIIPRGHKLEIVAAGADFPSMLLRRDQPFVVRVLFGLADTAGRRELPLAYTAIVHARSLYDKRAQGFIRASGNTMLSENMVIELGDVHLEPGAYRLAANITIHQPGAGPTLTPYFHLQTESALLRIY